jgi:signal transduction histidine kinase
MASLSPPSCRSLVQASIRTKLTLAFAGATALVIAIQYALASTVVGTVLAGLITVVMIVWATRHISTPLLEVSRAMRLLAAGDDTVAIANDRKRSDEIGTLIDAAAKFRSALVCSREFAAVAEQERERLNAAVSQMPVGLSMFDQSERLIICNGAFRRMYRLPGCSTGAPRLQKPRPARWQTTAPASRTAATPGRPS